MHEAHISVVGTAVTEVAHGATSGGAPVARFRLVCQPRRYDRGKGEWVDTEPSFYTVVCWRGLADSVAQSVAKGDPVQVSGRIRVREWTADEGRHGVSVEIDANSVGHDLARGTSAFTRATRTRGSPSQATADAAGASDAPGSPVSLAGDGAAAGLGEPGSEPAVGAA